MNLKSILTVFCVLAAAAMFIAPAAAEDSVTDHIIKVSGHGQSVTSPDKVTVVLGVEFSDTDAQAVQKKATETMKKVTDAVKAAGIKESDIKTQSYSLYSYTVGKYDESNYAEGTLVYKMTSTIEVTSYDVENIGSVVSKASEAGANKINNLQFGLSNEKQIKQRQAAIVSAVKAARADADSLAGALGLTITGTGVVSLDQSYIPVSYAESDMIMAAAVPKMALEAASGASNGAISAGDLSTTATVSIIYTY